MKLVDFHCHLDLYPAPAAVIAETDAAGIYTLSVTTTPRAWPQNLKFTAHVKHIRVALGLHPQLVAEHAREIDLWERYLPEARYVGEVGLDAGPRFFRSLDLQQQVFERILKCCSDAGGKILSVHSVRSAKTVLDMIEAHLHPSKGSVVLHWFTGSKSEARRAVDLGCYFSINLAMLSNDRTKAVVAELPADRLLTETDGPFTQVAGRPAQPHDISAVIDEMAALRSMHPQNMGKTVLANLRTLCGESNT